MLAGFGAVMLQSLVGLVLGVAVNAFNKAAVGGRWVRPARIALKLVPVALVALVAEAVAPGFADEWQVTVPGLFFVTMYFGTQTSLMEDVAGLA